MSACQGFLEPSGFWCCRQGRSRAALANHVVTDLTKRAWSFVGRVGGGLGIGEDVGCCDLGVTGFGCPVGLRVL